MTVHVEPPVAAYAEFAKRVRVVRSPGGIEAWLLEERSLPIVSMSFAFHGGAALDPVGRSGTARLMGSLLAEGAGTLDAVAYPRALADEAVRLRFHVEADGLSGHLQALAEGVGPAVALLRLALAEPHFAPDAVARKRAGQAASLKQESSDPGPIATRSLFARGFGAHPYARSASGDLHDLAAITREDIVALHRRSIVRGNLCVAVVGAIGPEALGAALDNAFADLPGGKTPDPVPTVLAGMGERVVTSVALPQSTLCFGRPGILHDDPDFIAATVVNHCLGSGHFTSRLMREVREKRGLCYGIGSGLVANAAACTFLGSTSVSNARVEETLAVIEDEIARLLRNGLVPAEIDLAKRYLIGAYGMQFDTTASIARLFLGLQIIGREPDWLHERGRRIAALRAQDAARATERLFGDGRMLVAIAGGAP